MIRADIAPARARSRRWSVAVGGALLTLTLAVSGCSVADEPAQSSGTEAGNTYLDGVLATPSQTSADPLAGDIQFAGLLLRNHRDVIGQSEELLATDGVDREIRSMAERAQSQHEERAGRLEAMLEGWGVSTEDLRGVGAEATPTPEAQPSEGGDPVPVTGDELRAGLLSEREKNVLAAADAEDAGRIYLLQMHRVYQGALTISATEAESGTDEEAKALAASVVADHQEDMQRMVEVLADMGAIGADASHTALPSGYTGPIKIEGTGADGGPVPSDFVPEPVQRVQSFRATQRPVLPTSSSPGDAEDHRGRDSATASPSPTPADTARPSPSPSSAASPSPSATTGSPSGTNR